jgi:copper chaperone CopZ
VAVAPLTLSVRRGRYCWGKRVTETLRLVVNPVSSGWEHTLKHALREVDGVLGVTASYKANLIGVTFDAGKVTAGALKQYVESLGYEVMTCG